MIYMRSDPPPHCIEQVGYRGRVTLNNTINENMGKLFEGGLSKDQRIQRNTGCVRQLRSMLNKNRVRVA